RLSLYAIAITDIYTLSLHDALPDLGDGLLDPAVLLGDDGALEDLNALTGALLDLHVHLHGVAHFHGEHLLDLRFGQLLDEIHGRSEEHTSELQSRFDIVCRLLLEKK